MGQTTVEYALLLALLAVVVLVAFAYLGPVIDGLFDTIGTVFQKGK
jgi:Flp pilus assembly pilin Flp